MWCACDGDTEITLEIKDAKHSAVLLKGKKKLSDTIYQKQPSYLKLRNTVQTFPNQPKALCLDLSPWPILQDSKAEFLCWGLYQPAQGGYAAVTNKPMVSVA